MEKREITFEVIASRAYHAYREDKFIVGPFSEIRWQQIRAIATTIGNTIADFVHCDRSGVKYALGMYENEGEVIPSVRTSVMRHDDNDHNMVLALVQRLLLLITQRPDVSSQIIDDQLDKEAEETVRANAQEFLLKNGGDRVTMPIDISMSGRTVGKLQCSFAPRPADMLSADRSRLHQVIVITMHGEKREGIARSVEDRKVINFRFADHHKIQLGESLVYDIVIDIELEEILDASGKKMLIVTNVRCSDHRTDGAFALT